MLIQTQIYIGSVSGVVEGFEDLCQMNQYTRHTESRRTGPLSTTKPGTKRKPSTSRLCP